MKNAIACNRLCNKFGSELSAVFGSNTTRFLPPGLVGLKEIGARYFKHFAFTNRSIHKEVLRLTLLCELFGDTEVASAIDEVMRTGHVGGE